MYGPVPTASQRGLGARLWTVLVRVVLTVVPLASLGMLAWIPMLRLAIVHRRRRDWLLFGAVAAASIGAMPLLGPVDSGSTAAGMVLLLGTAVFVSAYYLAVDLAPRRTEAVAGPIAAPLLPPVQPGYPPPGLPRPDRIEQVRAGLDELSAYLEQQRRP